MALRPKVTAEVEVLKDIKQRIIQAIASHQDLQEYAQLLADERVEIVLMDKQDEDEDRFMTVEQTAELFGVTPAAVYKWIQKNKIQFENISPVEGGRGYRIPKDQFEGKLVNKKKVDDAHRKVFGGEVEEMVIEDLDEYLHRDKD